MFQRMIGQIALCGAALVTSSAAAQFYPGSTINPYAVAQPVTSTTVVHVASAVPHAALRHDLHAGSGSRHSHHLSNRARDGVPSRQTHRPTPRGGNPLCGSRGDGLPAHHRNPHYGSAHRELPQCDRVPNVTRDVGQWVTTRECVNRPAACQYDPRPGLMGGLNRFGYSLRSAFTPNFRTRRQYVPNYVAQAVPVTRQVAVHSTRQVTYNLTRMERYKTTQKVRDELRADGRGGSHRNAPRHRDANDSHRHAVGVCVACDAVRFTDRLGAPVESGRPGRQRPTNRRPLPQCRPPQ